MREDVNPTKELTVWTFQVLEQGQAIFCEGLYVFSKTTPSVLPGPVPRAASDHMVTLPSANKAIMYPLSHQFGWPRHILLQDGNGTPSIQQNHRASLTHR